MVLRKIFFILMDNTVFGETMKQVRKNRDIKLATTEKRRNYLVSELNCHATKFFTEHILAIEMKETEMNKPVYFRIFNTRIR